MFEQAVYAKAFTHSTTAACGHSSAAEPDTEDTGVHHHLDTESAEVLDTMVAQYSDKCGFEVLEDAMDR